MPDITYDVGRVSFVMKGAWNLATSYEKLDVVSYNGSLYIAKQDAPGGTAITNTTYWQLAVEKGDQGETGNGIASITLTGTAGNVDTYTITFTDGTTTTFTVTNGGVTTVNGRTGDVTGLAEEDGSYPLLNAGTADNLTPYSEDSGATQDIPFIAQGTGCGNGESVVDTGSYLQFKKKLGNTVCVNQQVQNPHFASQTIWTNLASVSGGVGTSVSLGRYVGIRQDMSPVVGHKYLLVAEATADSNRDLRLCFFNSGTALDGFSITVTSGTFTRAAQIVTLSDVANRISLANWTAGNAVVQAKEILCIDLTLWFGSNDRIPSDLLSHPENWGRYYAGSLAYNTGTLGSADGTVMGSIGRNCWDGEWEAGSINSTTGANEGGATAWRTVNYIPVSPNAQYYFHYTSQQNLKGRFYDAAKNYIGFKDGNGNNLFSNRVILIPPNAHFVRFCPAESEVPDHTITVSRYYSGESGYDEDYDYSVLAEVDTGSEVLRSAGAIADEKLPDGTITRKVGYIDLGTLTWSYNTSGTYPVFIATLADAPSSITAGSADYHSSKYVSYPSTSLTTYTGTSADKTICRRNNNNTVLFQDSSYTSADLVDGHASWLEGQFFTYELATPTTEQGTAFAENIPCDDFGSMYWTQTKGIPQGNEIFYPVDYKASIDTLYNRVGGDMSKIVTEDEYPEAPSSDGTYVLKATVSGGTKTYAWVAE